MKSVKAILFSALACLLLMQVDFTDVTSIALSTLLCALAIQSAIPTKFSSGNLNAGLDVEVWKKFIIEKFRRDHSFLMKSRDDSGDVLGGAVVHIPQGGADPVVVKNRNVYPGVAVRRTDNDITYALDHYSTDPHHVPWAELQSLSYDKLNSMYGTHVDILTETAASDMLIRWAPSGAQLIYTTGGAGALTMAGVNGQTGTRKITHPDDLRKAMTRMDKDDVPKTGRICLMDADVYGAFYDQLTNNQAYAFHAAADLKNGIVGRLHGFDIMNRSLVLTYDNTGTVKPLGAVTAATDNLGAICYHPNVVARAVGEIKPFQDKDNPLYYGDIFSMIMRFGGRQMRADGKGVVGLVQAA